MSEGQERPNATRRPISTAGLPAVVKRKTSLEATAFHEAGHAVAAWLLKISVRREGVTIVPDQTNGSLGAISLKRILGKDIEWNASGKNRLHAERWVQVLLAGDVAQRRYNRHSVRHFHADSDHTNAIDILSYFSGDQRELEAWLKLLRIRTEVMLSDTATWWAVERLASALMQRRTLGWEDVAKIIREAYSETTS